MFIVLQPITTFTLHLSISSVNDNGLLGRGHKPEPKHDKAYSEKVLRLSLNEAIIWPNGTGSVETIIIFQELNIGCMDFVVSLVMSPLYLYHTLMSWRLISHASWKVTLQNTFGASVGLDVSK